MLARERLNKILEKVQLEGKVYVNELCELFDISEDSIRKDLKKLESQGIIERIYGGALLKKEKVVSNGLVRTIDFDKRLDEKNEIKEIVADKAFRLIKDGDLVYIDASSTNIWLAKKIAHSNLKITVVSNCLRILNDLSRNLNIRIICPGGSYDMQIAAFIGVSFLENIKNFYFDKAFMGVAAVDLTTGDLMLDNFNDSEIKSKLISRSNCPILMCLSEKLGKRSNYKFGNLDQLDTIITELDSKQIINKFQNFEVKVI